MSGCAIFYTAIDENTPPPVDWPELKITKHVVSHKEMNAVCSKYGKGWIACAVMDLHAKTCDIWMSKDHMNVYIEWHEEMHCKGYDHPGGTTIAGLINEYRTKTAEAK